MGSEEKRPELDGGGYARSGEGAAEWTDVTWTITVRVNACGFAWIEPLVTVGREGLKVAAGAITVPLS